MSAWVVPALAAIMLGGLLLRFFNRRARRRLINLQWPTDLEYHSLKRLTIRYAHAYGWQVDLSGSAFQFAFIKGSNKLLVRCAPAGFHGAVTSMAYGFAVEVNPIPLRVIVSADTVPIESVLDALGRNIYIVNFRDLSFLTSSNPITSDVLRELVAVAIRRETEVAFLRRNMTLPSTEMLDEPRSDEPTSRETRFRATHGDAAHNSEIRADQGTESAAEMPRAAATGLGARSVEARLSNLGVIENVILQNGAVRCIHGWIKLEDATKNIYIAGKSFAHLFRIIYDYPRREGEAADPATRGFLAEIVYGAAEAKLALQRPEMAHLGLVLSDSMTEVGVITCSKRAKAGFDKGGST